MREMTILRRMLSMAYDCFKFPSHMSEESIHFIVVSMLFNDTKSIATKIQIYTGTVITLWRQSKTIKDIKLSN